MNDRELLELAAKAAGIELDWDIPPNSNSPWSITGEGDERGSAAEWNPLTDDGDALRLAVKLGINIHNSAHSPSGIPFVYAQKLGYRPCLDYGDDEYAATRRAIVRAAAEIGRQA